MDRALVYWEDDTYFIISLRTVERPRKELKEYAVGDDIHSKIPGFPGKYDGKIVAISDDNKYLRSLMRRKQTEIPEHMEVDSVNSNSVNLEFTPQESDQVHDPEPEAPKKKVCKGRANKENELEKERKREATQSQKDIKEKKKAETEKRKAETEKRKTEEIRRNSSFLQSLEEFKNATTTEPPIQTSCQPVSFDTNTEPQTFMESNEPRTVLQPSVLPQVESQLSSPHYMDLQMPQLHFTPRLPRRISNEDQHNSRYSQFLPQWDSTPVSRMLNDARETLHCYDQESSSQCFNATCEMMRAELRTAHDNLKVAQRDKNRLEEMLRATKEELELLQNGTQVNRDEQSYNLQADGRPRAGRVPSSLANAHHMVELMPGTGVYVYPKHIITAQRKHKGTSVARFLMSVFYTNTELIECGNLSGCHGKKGLDRTIADAILDYAVSIHGQNLLTEIKFSMRTKISALVSLSRKGEK